SIGYNSDLFDKETAVRLGCHFGQLLQAMLDHPDVPLNVLDYLSVSERQQVTTQFALSRVSVPEGRTVVQLFEEQVRRTPDAVALIAASRSISYSEMADKTHRLASWLVNEAGVRRGDVVGILLERTENLILAIWGILKAGATYVVIEPEYPRVRKEAIVVATEMRVLITQSEFLFGVNYFAGSLFAMDMQLDEISASDIDWPAVQPADLAYILFTSGSTGVPKGVMIEHGSLVDYFYGLKERIDISDCKSFALVSTPAADLGNTVLYPALLLGASLRVITATEAMDPEFMAGVDVDCVKIVPSHWKALQDGGLRFVPRRVLIFGGEQLTADVLGLLRDGKASCMVFNHYGPSETTIGKLIRQIDFYTAGEVIALGSPFGNTQVYILDGRGMPCPIGVPGEISIGGDGVARGYLGLAEQTEERFIRNPFVDGSRMYRTGDSGKWVKDGNIVFLGRRDQQVKIRGYRIETGEVEAALRHFPGMEGAVVRAVGVGKGELGLAAWYVHGEPVDQDQIKSFLSKYLPGYMVPEHFMRVTEIPLTANGKVDTVSLPDPVQGEMVAAEYMAPRTATERQLALIWEDVLGKDRPGVNDNFFALGGHSLKVTRLASQIHKVFNAGIEFHELFEYTSLGAQAALIDRAPGSRDLLAGRVMTIAPAADQADYPLSSAQRRLWLLSQFEESNIAYNIPRLFRCSGYLDAAALEAAFNAVIARHEILRTALRENGTGELRQYILPAEKVRLKIGYTDLRRDADGPALVKELAQRDAS
ncbi:MAG TPA: amino acid adenylation domain-containing protein, partial [Puia sp.]|nr:amino acid adenylation domain-containing protein [Puia sp.]